MVYLFAHRSDLFNQLQDGRIPAKVFILILLALIDLVQNVLLVVCQFCHLRLFFFVLCCGVISNFLFILPLSQVWPFNHNFGHLCLVSVNQFLSDLLRYPGLFVPLLALEVRQILLVGSSLLQTLNVTLSVLLIICGVLCHLDQIMESFTTLHMVLGRWQSYSYLALG